jgi:hypothetical protein
MMQSPVSDYIQALLPQKKIPGIYHVSDNA